jgi:modulator of FtsH protease HflK
MSDNQQIELKPKVKTGTPALAAVSQDDSGSQALSEALQSSFFIVKFLMIGLVIVFLGSGFFTLGPQEKAIILRFGKPVGEGESALLGAGFHWAFPRPIDEVVRIPIGQIQSATSTVGWYATTPEAEALHQEPPPGPSLNPANNGYALTSDANIVHARATLRYRVTDPIRFHFDYVNAADFVTNALNNSLLYSATHYTVDDVLIRKVAAFRESVTARVQELIDAQHLGIVVEQIDVVVIPPRQLQAKFSEVLQASIKSDDAHNKAESYANEVLSKARAERESFINAAQADRARLVGQVEAEAKGFSEILPIYKANPELYVRKQQTETVGKVLAKAQEKIFVPNRGDGKSRELRLQLSREPQAPAPVPAAN